MLQETVVTSTNQRFGAPDVIIIYFLRQSKIPCTIQSIITSSRDAHVSLINSDEIVRFGMHSPSSDKNFRNRESTACCIHTLRQPVLVTDAAFVTQQPNNVKNHIRKLSKQ